jgi:hypothetical protein
MRGTRVRLGPSGDRGPRSPPQRKHGMPSAPERNNKQQHAPRWAGVGVDGRRAGAADAPGRDAPWR